MNSDSSRSKEPERDEQGDKNALRSAHEPKRIRKKLRSTEIAGFQGKQHAAFFSTDSAQHRDTGGDLHANEKSGNLQAIDNGTGCLATRDDQSPYARLHKALGDIGQGALDGMTGCVAAVTQLQRCDLIRRRARRDQNGTFGQSLASPSPARAAPRWRP